MPVVSSPAKVSQSQTNLWAELELLSKRFYVADRQPTRAHCQLLMKFSKL